MNNRIKITRDYKWVKKLWKDTIFRQQQSFVHVEKSTGGGHETAENFHNWKEKNEEIFEEYRTISHGLYMDFKIQYLHRKHLVSVHSAEYFRTI